MPAPRLAHGALTDFAPNVKASEMRERLGVNDFIFLACGLSAFGLMALYALACDRL